MLKILQQAEQHNLLLRFHSHSQTDFRYFAALAVLAWEGKVECDGLTSVKRQLEVRQPETVVETLVIVVVHFVLKRSKRIV